MQITVTWRGENPDLVPLSCDYFLQRTPILLHGEGTDGSTTFTNSGSGNFSYNITDVGGSAQIDTAQKKFGSSSILFIGTGTTTNGSYVATSNNSSSSNPAYIQYLDFSLDMWVRPDNLPSEYAYLVDGRPVATEGAYPALRINSSGYLEYFVSSAIRITSSIPMSEDVWTYVELSRTGGTTRLFMDGAIVGTWADTTSYIATQFLWGCSSFSNHSTQRYYGFNGWMDEIRITRNFARHDANYTPPTAISYDSICNFGLNTFISSLAPRIWYKYDDAFTGASSWSAGSTFSNSGSETGITALVYAGNAGGADMLCAESLRAVNCSGTFPGYAGNTATFVSQYQPNSVTTYYQNTLTICMNIQTADTWSSADRAIWHEGAAAVANNQGMYFTYRVSTKILDVNYYASGGWNTQTIADLTAMGGLVNNARYHLAWVFIHATKVMKVYVNGVLKGTVNMTYSVPATTYKANVGRVQNNNTTSGGNSTPMAVDNFMIFSSEISAEDIEKLYRYSLPPDLIYEPPPI